MFENYGSVQYCTLILDKETGDSKGFGFVEMPNPGEAKAAMKSLNGNDVDGNKIRVKKAAPKADAENAWHIWLPYLLQQMDTIILNANNFLFV